MSRILLAGGAGFLGSNLADRLISEKHQVVVFDNLFTGRKKNLENIILHPNFQFIESDVTSLHSVAKFYGDKQKFDFIFNFACPASPPKYQKDPVQTLITSVMGTKHLLSLAHVHGATFIQASTSEVYGDPTVHPQSESYRGTVNCFGPRSCYDEGKRCAETLCYDFHMKHNVPVKVARIFNTYGPKMDPKDGRVITNFLCQALAGKKLTLYGDGSQTRSFMYVDDIIEAFLRLMETPKSFTGPINIGNPNEFTMRHLGELVMNLVCPDKEDKSFTFCSLPGDDPTQRCPDITLAKQVLKGWEPKISLADGLKYTLRYIKTEMNQ